ncbi:glutaminase liver isoform, mitochondrial-like isoform X2 [Mya arenaria]|uniref:glutaminase liver isoform, mitochondrial-like isoform X2 n=1 Tax=Mya arenaria TaxID=6604 RepID=UPI0022E71003|nr:glutaminase liver isoform, mitochondrial-like isoform X2 [Mya arenaria]
MAHLLQKALPCCRIKYLWKTFIVRNQHTLQQYVTVLSNSLQNQTVKDCTRFDTKVDSVGRQLGRTYVTLAKPFAKYDSGTCFANSHGISTSKKSLPHVLHRTESHVADPLFQRLKTSVSRTPAASLHQQRRDGVESTNLHIEELEDKLFDYLCEDSQVLLISKFKKAITSTGLRETDPRLADCMRNFTKHTNAEHRDDHSHHGPAVDRETFKQIIAPNIVLIASAFRNQFVVPDFDHFCKNIDQMYWNCRDQIGGKVATYIPQLARYNPNMWGVSLCTVDGQRYSHGDVQVPFCLQSVSKPLTYAMVLDELSPRVTHEYVGQEPSGESFDSISLDYRDKPHNPMINAGAISVCSLLKQNLNLADRFDYVTSILKRLTGGEYLAFNNSVFLSERETADRNFALAYYMREKKCFPEGCNLMETLDFYFQMCSLEVTCESGAVIAATLANGGICPITGDKVLSASSVRDTLSLMLSCGMYDYSGEFAFKVGLPAKSGVSGVILIVVPNKMGFCTWCPALDKWGNSVRGVQFARDLVAKFNFHHYDNLKFTAKKIDPCIQTIESRASEVVNLLFSAYNCDVSALRRYALSDLDMDQADYDGRTALHIGSAEGHEPVVNFLINKCKCNPNVVDRWGFTPLDDAVRFGHTKVISILKEAMNQYNANEKIDRSFAAIDSVTYSDIAFKAVRTVDDASTNLMDRKTSSDEVIYNIDNAHNELEGEIRTLDKDYDK